MRFPLAAILALVASGPYATSAWAEEPKTVEVSLVTYYVELGDLSAEKSEALAALLKREFPEASIALFDGTLRVQTDDATFPALSRLLESQREATLEGLPRGGGAAPNPPAAPKPPARPVPLRVAHPEGEVRVIGVGKESGVAASFKGADETATVLVDVGQLCAGCADCLASALGREFPDARFSVHGEKQVKVRGTRAQQAGVQAWLGKLRAATRAHDAQEAPELAQELFVLRGADGKTLRVQELAPNAYREVLTVMGDDAGSAEQDKRRDADMLRLVIRELQRDGDGHKAELHALHQALVGLEAKAEGDDDAADATEADVKYLTIRKRLGDLRDEFKHFTAFGGRHDAQRPEAKDRPAPEPRLEGRPHGDKKPHPAHVPRDPKREAPKADAPKGERRPEGPLADFRRKFDHLRQAAEHLAAAGFEGLAKQTHQAMEGLKREAEEQAERIRQKEVAEQARRQAEQAREQAEHARRKADEAARRELEVTRKRQEGGSPGADDLRHVVEVVRSLKQEVESLRKELAKLREQLAK